MVRCFLTCLIGMHICILICMNRGVKISAEALAIADKARANGITQCDIAEGIGASQPQVSRILAGHISRPSRLFQEICSYVRTRTDGVTLNAVRDNEELVAALAATWDGSAHHAEALAAVIRGLAVLGPGERGKYG